MSVCGHPKRANENLLGTRRATMSVGRRRYYAGFQRAPRGGLMHAESSLTRVNSPAECTSWVDLHMRVPKNKTRLVDV